MAATVLPYQTRQRLAASAAFAFLAMAGTAVALGVAMLWPRTWERASSVQQLRSGTPQLLMIAGQEIYLLWENGAPLALSTRDPHGPYGSGCQNPRVRYDAASAHFIDPCGGATYERNGSYVRGPSPRSLDRFPVRVNAGQVEIDAGETIPGKAHF